jgi:rubrerythrin
MASLAQAIRNAIEAERAAGRFYTDLLDKAADPKTNAFFAEMAKQEEEHARSIEEVGQKLATGELPQSADSNVAAVETISSWRDAKSISLEEALDLAISAEQSASLYYDAIADYFSGEGERFFRDLSACEMQHAERLIELKERRAKETA